MNTIMIVIWSVFQFINIMIEDKEDAVVKHC